MKGLIWNCNQVEWQNKNEKKFLADCLLVLVCFEKNDTLNTIKEGVRRVNQLNKKRYNRTSISIFPFAHLSKDILNEKDALEMLNIFFKKISNHFSEIQQIPFKIEKEIFFHLLPGKEDVSYFEY
ncbi:MAG: threonyl-tRNA synthetase editing domain-containing protein [Patescibacteria group bacterium]